MIGILLKTIMKLTADGKSLEAVMDVLIPWDCRLIVIEKMGTDSYTINGIPLGLQRIVHSVFDKDDPDNQQILDDNELNIDSNYAIVSLFLKGEAPC